MEFAKIVNLCYDKSQTEKRGVIMEILQLDAKRQLLMDYYKEKGLLIIGLNDSQGVNTTSFFKKGLLEYIQASLTTSRFTPEVINAFSLLFNKTEHIDYLLRSNLSVEEIKLAQNYSMVSVLEKLCDDFWLPEILGQIGNLYHLVNTPELRDKNIRITSALKEAEEPTIIYSSGVNNLMREVGNNPFGIKRDYKLRNTRPNYNYTVEKMNDPCALNKVIDSIAINFETIFSVNPKTDIYTLGAYVPKSLQTKEMDIFSDYIQQYNEKVQSLCNGYKITFVNTEMIGKQFNTSENNFHISTDGHQALGNYILDMMYQRKIENPIGCECTPREPFEVSIYGSQRMKDFLLVDYLTSLRRSISLEDYEQERQMKIAEEHSREHQLFCKVLKKTKNQESEIVNE